MTVIGENGERRDKLDLKVTGLAPLVGIVRLFALRRGR